MFTPVPRVHIRVLPVFTPAPRPTFPAHGAHAGRPLLWAAVAHA